MSFVVCGTSDFETRPAALPTSPPPHRNKHKGHIRACSPAELQGVLIATSHTRRTVSLVVD